MTSLRGGPSIGLLGSTGRMGRTIQALLKNSYSERCRLTVEASRASGVTALFDCDTIIDFSSPEAFCAMADAAANEESLPNIVTGTTGWTPEQWAKAEALAQRTPVVYSANFSIGVFFLKDILRHASESLKRAGYDPVLVETHHIHKLDAPSGTAKALCEAISPGRGDSVPVHSIRAGEVIGDHEVTFYGAADKVTISHSAQDRTIFARGAIDVALWLADPARRPAATKRILTLDDYFSERFGRP